MYFWHLLGSFFPISSLENFPPNIFRSELLSRESKELLWNFIDTWLTSGGDSECLTAKSCFEKILRHGKSLLSENAGSIFELSLQLRSSSSRIALYRQLAKDSLASISMSEMGFGIPDSDQMSSMNPNSPKGHCCWVDTGSSLLFNASEFLSALESSSEG